MVDGDGDGTEDGASAERPPHKAAADDDDDAGISRYDSRCTATPMNPPGMRPVYPWIPVVKPRGK
jgi:hypothetical protein